MKLFSPSVGRRTAGLVVVACFLAFAVNAAPAAAVGPRARGSRGPIVSPRSGRTFRRDSVPLVLRAGTRIGEFSARLNGRRVTGQFAVGPRHTRVLRASDSDGLRRVANVLSVAVWDGFKVSGKVLPDMLNPIPVKTAPLIVTGAVPVDVTTIDRVAEAFTITF